MKLLLDAFWRAVAYCVHPKVIGLSLLPFLVGGALAFGLGWMYWEAAVAGVRAALENWSLVDAALKLVESLFGASFRSVLAPIIVVVLAAPVIVVLAVLLVALLMMPAIVSLVTQRRFPAMERKRGSGWLGSAFWSLGCTLVALLALLLTMPLWFVPPLAMLVQPLIWGWLTYQVMSHDALADHASAAERRELIKQHGLPLLTIGIISGYLGAAPSLVWAFSAATLIFAPLLIVVSVWLYTLVFAFSSLWFAHYVLAALDAMRAQASAAVAAERQRGEAQVIDVTAIDRGHAAPTDPTLPGAPASPYLP